MAKILLDRALRHQVPESAQVSYNPSNHVLVCRERKSANWIGEWASPFEVDRSFAQPKKYLAPVHHAKVFITKVSNAIKWFESPNLIKYIESNLNEFLDSANERCKTPDISTAIRMEVEGLLYRGKFKFIIKKVVSDDGNVLPGHFELSI